MEKVKVLIIEDEIVVAHDLADMISQWGYDVVGEVSSGEEAVEKARATSPNLVLADIKPAGPMDGIESPERISAKLDTAIVYLTARTESDFFDRAKETEPYGYLTKPVAPQELLRTVEMAVYKHKMEKRLERLELEKDTILNSIHELVTYQDRDRKVLWANRTAGDSVGLSPDELVGRRCYEIWNNRTDRCPECPVISAMDSGTVQKKEVTTPEGRIWLINAYPVIDPEDKTKRVVESH